MQRNPTVRLQSRGRLTLPVEVRSALNAQPGDEVSFVETAPGRIEVRAKTQSALLSNGSRKPNRMTVPTGRRGRQLELGL